MTFRGVSPEISAYRQICFPKENKHLPLANRTATSPFQELCPCLDALHLSLPLLTVGAGTHKIFWDQTLSFTAQKWHLNSEIQAIIDIHLEIFCVKESVFHFHTSSGLCIFVG